MMLDPGPTTRMPEFMKPLTFRSPAGCKFSVDNKVNVLDKEYNLKEGLTKPGPGTYEVPGDFD